MGEHVQMKTHSSVVPALSHGQALLVRAKSPQPHQEQQLLTPQHLVQVSIYIDKYCQSGAGRRRGLLPLEGHIQLEITISLNDT